MASITTNTSIDTNLIGILISLTTATASNKNENSNKKSTAKPVISDVKTSSKAAKSTATSATGRSSKILKSIKTGENRGKRTLYDFNNPAFVYPQIAARRASYDADSRSTYNTQLGYFNGQNAIAQFPSDYNLNYSPYPQYLEAPEPIIEIIIKDSNETLPETSVQPIVTKNKKKKEKVHVFYVNYKKDKNNKLHLESPIASLNNDETEEEEEEEDNIVHYTATPLPPVKPTTLRTIIHPDSEKYHSNSGIHVTFGSEDNHQSDHISEENDAESIQREVVAVPLPRTGLKSQFHVSSRNDFQGEPRSPFTSNFFQASAPWQYQAQEQQKQFHSQQQQLPSPHSSIFFKPPIQSSHLQQHPLQKTQQLANQQYSTNQYQKQPFFQQTSPPKPLFTANTQPSGPALVHQAQRKPLSQINPQIQQQPQYYANHNQLYQPQSQYQQPSQHQQPHYYQPQSSIQQNQYFNTLTHKPTQPPKSLVVFPTAPAKSEELPARHAPQPYQPIKFRPTPAPTQQQTKTTPIAAKLENSQYNSKPYIFEKQSQFIQHPTSAVPIPTQPSYKVQIQQQQPPAQPYQQYQTQTSSQHQPQSQSQTRKQQPSQQQYQSQPHTKTEQQQHSQQQYQPQSHSQTGQAQPSPHQYQPQHYSQTEQQQHSQHQYQPQSHNQTEQQQHPQHQHQPQSHRQTEQQQHSQQQYQPQSHHQTEQQKHLQHQYQPQSHRQNEQQQHLQHQYQPQSHRQTEQQQHSQFQYHPQSQSQTEKQQHSTYNLSQTNTLHHTQTKNKQQQEQQQQAQLQQNTRYQMLSSKQQPFAAVIHENLNWLDIKPSKETELFKSISKFEQHITETLPNSYNHNQYQVQNKVIHDIPAPNLGSQQQLRQRPQNQALRGHYITGPSQNSQDHVQQKQQEPFTNFVTVSSNLEHAQKIVSSTQTPQYGEATDGQKIMIVTPMPPNAYEQYQAAHSYQRPSQGSSSNQQHSTQIINSIQPSQELYKNYYQQPRQGQTNTTAKTTISANNSPYSVSNYHSDVFQELEQRNSKTKDTQYPYGTQSTTTTPSTTTTGSSTTINPKTLLQLPDEVPDELRQQLLSSGILGNADISVLDYDKLGDTALENLPAEHLQHFYGAGGGAQISETKKVLTVLKPNGDKISLDEREIDKVKQTSSVTHHKPSDVKIVRYEGQKAENSEVPQKSTERQYNRYLPLKINAANFPKPDVENLDSKYLKSIVVLAPVDTPTTQDATALEDPKEVKFLGGDLIKTLVKKPTKENFKRWLDKESRTDVEQQSVVLLVAKSSNSSEQEIFMYDITTGEVNKLNGELSSKFVSVAEENASTEDLEHGLTLDPNIMETMLQPPTSS